METHFPRSHYNPTHTEVTEPLEQEGTGCPWQTCSRDLLRSYNCRRELRESQSYTAWTGPEATGSTPCFGKPLLLIVLMALSPAVPKEQALLTWLCLGRESPTAPTFCSGCPALTWLGSNSVPRTCTWVTRPQVEMLAQKCWHTSTPHLLLFGSACLGDQAHKVWHKQKLRGFEVKRQTANLHRLHLAAPIATLPPSSTHICVKVFYTQWGCAVPGTHSSAWGALEKPPDSAGSSNGSTDVMHPLLF